MARYSAGVVLDCAATSSGPASSPAAALSSGRSSASTIAGEPLARARVSAAVAVTPGSGPHRRHDRDGVLHRVEHHDQRRADQHRVGNADRVGIGRGQLLHQPHHVVAEIAEHAGRHRRQVVGQRDAAFGDQRAQRLERRLRARRRNASGVGARRAVDLGALRRRRARSGPARGRSPNSGRAPRRLRPTPAGSSSACRRRSSGRPRPAFRGRRPAWSTPPAPRRARSARRRRLPTARSAWRRSVRRGWRR